MKKRKLSNEEIDYLLDFLEPNKMIPLESANVIIENLKKRLRMQLIGQEVYPAIIPELKRKIQYYYYQSQITPGESVGILAAQAIGEINTQSTLNTFHKAGQNEKSVTQGVPRFQELLNATKQLKCVNCKIYFNEGNKTIQELRNTVKHQFAYLTLNDISEKILIRMYKKKESWYEIFAELFNDRFQNHHHCVSIKVSKPILFKYRIYLNDIVNKIEEEYDDLHCVISSEDVGQIDIFVDMSKIKFTESQLSFVTQENMQEIYMDECVLPKLKTMNLFGIEGINNIYFVNENNEWILETDGSNFKKLLGHKLVAMEKLQSNSVWDIYDNLGIEAARKFLIGEFHSIMEGINICHVKLLVEKMTFTGTIASISRYTLRKDESGPLSKASFEESVDHMVKSAFAGDVEKTRGVSASIICGKRASIGTGFVDLKINTNKLIPNKK
jgi:DNA-directed RNA polymerase beta' subunit